MDNPNQWGFLLLVLVVNAYIFGMIYWVWNHPESKIAKHFERRANRRRKWRSSTRRELAEVRSTRGVGNTNLQRSTGQRPDRNKK
jgi:hypothetical protein